MISTRARIKTILLMGAGVLLVGCGGTSAPASTATASAAKPSAAASLAASAKPAASGSVSAKPVASAGASAAAKPAASGPALTANVYNFEAVDYSFNGPASIQGGLVTLRLTNSGKEPHHLQLMKLNTGATMDQLTAAVAAGSDEAIFKLVSFPGGVGAIDPNGNAEIVANLSDGQYIIACFIMSPDGVPHLAKGMIKPLTVTAPAASAAASVQAGQTVTMKDFTFDGPTTFTPGRVVIKVDNSGPQVHEMNILKLAPGKQMQDVLNFFKSIAPPPAASAKPAASGAAAASAPAKPAASVAGGASAVGGASAAAKPAGAPAGGPPPFSAVGGANGESQNLTEWAVMNLDAGDYVFICNVPDPASGQPHSALGMVKQFSVK